jgi:hypothetical protein
MPIAIGGISVPDSKLAREIAELVRDTESPLLFHHSSRVFYWGALTGVRRGVTFDAELLYAAVMAAIDYRSDRHPSGRRRSPRAAEKEDGSACAARGARASAARERPQRLVLTLSARGARKVPAVDGKRFAVALGLPVRGFFSEDAIHGLLL